MRSLLRCSLGVFLVVLTACATYAPRRVNSGAVEVHESTDSAALPSSTDRADVSTPDDAIIRDGIPSQAARSGNVMPVTPAPALPKSAATILLEEVDAAVAQGNLERAAALCERALRIEPRDAFLWYRLAYIRAQQGRADEANGFAQRALSFSTSNPVLTRQINEFIKTL